MYLACLCLLEFGRTRKRFTIDSLKLAFTDLLRKDGVRYKIDVIRQEWPKHEIHYVTSQTFCLQEYIVAERTSRRAHHACLRETIFYLYTARFTSSNLFLHAIPFKFAARESQEMERKVGTKQADEPKSANAIITLCPKHTRSHDTSLTVGMTAVADNENTEAASGLPMPSHAVLLAGTNAAELNRANGNVVRSTWYGLTKATSFCGVNAKTRTPWSFWAKIRLN